MRIIIYRHHPCNQLLGYKLTEFVGARGISSRALWVYLVAIDVLIRF
jgi:hypothetical protein